jgi:uncharacterized phage protein gp47/JayE
MGTQEDIIQRINERLTIDANLLEGGFSQDIIGSVAYELANIYDTEINNITNKVFVETATGEDLDKVGADYGVTRRQSSASIVYLEITGVQGATVNQNVKATYNNLVFTVQEYKVIGSSGSVTVKAQCDTTGSIGNVAANTITEFVGTYSGLTSVNNPLAAYDGFDTETDSDYRARIKLYLAEDAVNCNEAQYKLWALEVTGVKTAVIKDASTMGAGNVGVYISSTTGTVSQELINAVKAYIEEKQFINANLIVGALTSISINTAATIRLKTGATIDSVIQEYSETLAEYLETVTDTVSYFRASDILFACSGVDDVLSFTLNGEEASIALEDTEIPVVGGVNIGT